MRPLIVLVLVVGAIGALLFAVNSLIGGDPDQVGIAQQEPDQPRPSDGGQEVEPEDLVAPTTTERSGAVRTPTEVASDPGAAAPAASDQNMLVGRVVDPEGNGIAGAQVSLEEVELGGLFQAQSPKGPAVLVQTNADGDYVFRNVAAGNSYMLTARHDDYSRAEHSGLDVRGGRVEAPALVLRKGPKLHGLISDTGGNPVPDATVTLERRRFYSEDKTDPDRIVVQSEATGRYEITNVAQVHGHLRVEADGYGTKSITLRNKRGDNELNVTLEVAERLGGIVYGPGDAPIEGARILAMRMPSTHTTSMNEGYTGPDGRFLLENVDPGSYSVSISAEGFKQVAMQRIEAGDMNVTVRMNRRAVISGRVLDLASGAPVTTGTVRLRRVQQNTEMTSPTQNQATFQSPEGKYEIANVSRGTYLVEASAPGFAPTYSQSFTVIEGQSVPGIDVRLTQGGTISGRIVDSEGKGVSGARVTTHDNHWTDDPFTRSLGDMFPTNATTRTVVSGADGSFKLTGLMEATYQVRVHATGFAEFYRQDIRVSQGVEQTVGDLMLSRGGSVTGVVYGTDGKPSAGTEVRMVLANRAAGRLPLMFETKSDANGRYTIRNVQPGEYALQAIMRYTRNANGDLPPSPLDMKDARVEITVKESIDLTQDLRLGS